MASLTEEEIRARNREYRRKYVERNRETVIERNRQQREKVQTYVNSVKEGVPCADCGGVFPPCAMDFDHLEDKVAAVSQLIHRGWGVEKIKTEIAKCELVCATCHRIRTHIRKQTNGV